MWRRDTGTTAALAKRVVELRYKDIPAEVIEATKILCLDSLGSMLAGSKQPIGQVLYGFLKEESCRAEATAVGMGLKTSDYLAALANGSTGRSMDFDPEAPGHHPCGPNLPPALALSEKLGRGGKDLLEAFAIGVETQIRIDEAGRSDPSGTIITRRGRGPVGAISAAAVASKLMGLDVITTQRCFGLAAARTGAIDSTGTMASPGDSGHVASMAVLYARLAASGFTGRENAIEEPQGFKQFLGDDADVGSIPKRFANPWAVSKAGIRLKRYNCQLYNHPTIDAILNLYTDKPWRPQEVKAIRVKTQERSENINWNYYNLRNTSPRSGMDGRFSVAYIAAVTALDGRLDIDSFSDEKRFSPALVQMLEKVKITLLEDKARGASDMRSEVTIEFTDGSSRTASVVGVRLISTREERVKKFIDCARRAISLSAAERVVELVDNLEKQTDLDEFFYLLRGPAR